MAITKAPRNIRVTVPKHNSQTIGAKLDVEIKKQAKEKGIRADIAQPAPELAQAIESASEWNSLLITARAERGPQWDIGTQQFLVEQYSDLYYDATPLFDVVNKVKEEEGGGPSQQPEQRQHQQHPHHHQLQQHQQQQQHQQHGQHPHQTPHHGGQHYPGMGTPRHQTPMRADREFQPQMGGQHIDQSPMRHGHGGGPMQANFPYGGQASPGMNMRGPQAQQGPFPVGGGATPFNPMQQPQFFAGQNNPGGTPMRMGSIGGIPNMDDHGMGHGAMGGGMGMGGGMQGMGTGGGVPAMTRRMTRGMGGEEGFPMH